MNTARFRPVNQQCISPDPEDSQLRALVSQSEPTRVLPTRRRGWSHHRPKSPRVVIPVQQPRDVSKMDKRRRRSSPHRLVVGRQQAPRKAKPIPSIEESAQKGPFDPYAFLSLPPTPSLSSLSPNDLNAPGKRGQEVSPHDGNMVQPHSPPIPSQEQNFGHRQSEPFRCSPRKYGLSGPFAEWTATEKTNPALASNSKTVAISNDSNEVKREGSTPFTPFRDPVIRCTSVAASLQDTQIRERKLEEHGVVELDRDEFALQRFLKVQGEMTNLEAILMKGKKRHVFEQLKKNAATKSLRGVEKISAENDATPTPSGRPKSKHEQNSDAMSKVADMRTETSQCGPAIIEDALSTSSVSRDKTDRSQKDHQSDHGIIHPSRKHALDLPEGPRMQEKSQPAPPPKAPKRKELPGMGLIFNPRPNPPEDARKLQEKKLPRDLQRRQVNMPGFKDTVEINNDADIENAIDSAQNWLQHENTRKQEARAKRWKADPNWKALTTEQADAMRRQGSIPPSTFYGHRPKWRPPPGWRQPPVMETPTITLAEADKILASVKGNRVSRLLDPELASSKLPHPKNEKKINHSHPEKKIQYSTHDESKHTTATGTKDLNLPKATSTSREEKKDVMHAIGHEDDTQRSIRDDRPAVEPRVKPARDAVEVSKMKSPRRKRKRDTDVTETIMTASTMKDVPASPDLPLMKEIIEGSQMANTSSPVKKKKSKKTSSPEAVEAVVNSAKKLSTPSRSKKRKKAKESVEQHEVAGEGTPSKTKKRKGSGHSQESDEAVVEMAPPETLFDRLTKMKKKREKALALREATTERSQLMIPTPEVSKTNKLDLAPPIVPEPADEDAWQPMAEDEDQLSPPQPSASTRKKHRSKRHRQAKAAPAIAVDNTTPETMVSPTPASPSNEPTHASFNHLRRRHQSLPLPLTPETTSPTANPNTIPPASQPPPLDTPANLYDLNLLAISNRLSNLEAAVAAAPAPPNGNPDALTPLAARKLLLPPLPRAVPPGTTRLSDAELIQIGKRANKYERHKGAPYAFSWRGRLYADYDYLLDWVDNRGRAGWDHKEKARLKH